MSRLYNSLMKLHEIVIIINNERISVIRNSNYRDELLNINYAKFHFNNSYWSIMMGNNPIAIEVLLFIFFHFSFSSFFFHLAVTILDVLNSKKFRDVRHLSITLFQFVGMKWRCMRFAKQARAGVFFFFFSLPSGDF